MTVPNGRDWLDELFEQDEPYINDDGFTEAVIARLPETRKGIGFRLSLGVLSGLGLFGLLVASGSLGSLSARIGFPPEPSAALWTMLMVAAALVWIPFTIALEEE